MREIEFEVTLMVPVIHKVKATSIKHAENQINKAYNINKKKDCAKGTTQPFIHSMKIVGSKDVEPEVA